MPNRIIKESICYSESIRPLSWFEEVVFYRLIVNVDDYGRLDGRAEMLKARLFPLRSEISVYEIEAALDALEAEGLVKLYEAGGMPYIALTGWKRHQHIRALRSRYPAPADERTADAGNCVHLPPKDGVIQSESKSISEIEAEKEREKGEMTSPTLLVLHNGFKVPTVEQVRAYCEERGLRDVDPERFVHYYETRGWKVGGGLMRSWKASVNNWQRRALADQNPFLRDEI